MFKGFGQPKDNIQPQFKQFVDTYSQGYAWLSDEVSNDKDATQKLAQFVMRCLAIIKSKPAPAFAKYSGSKLEEFQMQFARMLAYGYYATMSHALAENEPSGVEGMSCASTINVLCQATDEQLHNLDAIYG